jgi:MOSC domain-containing protein YiiM
MLSLRSRAGSIRMESNGDDGGEMHVVSVNVGKEQPIRGEKPSGKTGIYKLPQAAPVLVTPLGLVGDAIVDTQNHGGTRDRLVLRIKPCQ